MTTAIALALSLAASGPAAGQGAPPPAAPTTRPTDRAFYTATDLHARCTSRDQNLRLICAGYVAGIADAVSSAAGAWGYTACIPLTVTPLAATEVVTRFLAAHPDGRNNVAANVVAAALAESYPCRADTPWATPNPGPRGGATPSPALPADAPPPAAPAPTRR